MYHIAICIPTYRRAAMLRKLIRSIFSCELDRNLIRQVQLVVVDNDAEQSARPVVEQLMGEENEGFELHYHAYPVKGLAHVRNELIRLGLSTPADFLLFIDDDEYASPTWLQELVSTLVRQNGDVGMGPVVPVFEKKVPPYIAQWFNFHRIEDQHQVDFVETGNLIIRTTYLRSHPQLRFDERFNTTGAEDSYFGVCVQQQGTPIWWAARAVAYETIPERRATIDWLLRRAYRGAITYTFIILLEKNYIRVLKKILVSFLYLLIGIPALLLTPFHSRFRYYGMMKLAESVGGFAGLFNLKYHEYAKGR